MRKILKAAPLFVLVCSLLLSGIIQPSQASSHREAPLIVGDPLADNTDVYAFRSTEAGRSGFVTLIANYVPFEAAYGGPHFYKFDDTVLYEIKVDNTGDGVEDVAYQFQFTNNVVNGDTILGMAAPNEALKGKGGIDPLIATGNDEDFNETQYFTVTRVDHASGPNGKVLGKGLHTPPCNIGNRTTPDYEKLAQHTVHQLPNGGRVFAGQRDEGFYVDVASIFDTLNLRSITSTGSRDATAGFNVHSIAIEVPMARAVVSGFKSRVWVIRWSTKS
jgi:hypothetical protein